MGLKWNAINFDTGMLHITNTLQYSPEKGIYNETPKTRNSVRFVKLTDSVVEMLKLQKAQYDASHNALGDYWNDSGYVFVQDNGKPMHPDSIRIWLAEFEKRNPSLPHMNLHAFRHTFVSILIADNVDIAKISRTIGHSDITTTMNTYARLIQEHDIEKRESLGINILAKISEPTSNENIM